jgi:hypothetical protein
MTEILRGIEATAHGLESLPKPRVVLPSWGTFAAPGMLFFFLCIFALVFKSNHDDLATDAVGMVFAACFCFVLVSGIISDLKDRKLLVSGNCCFGEITSQNWVRKGGGGRSSKILYAFPAGGHRTMIGEGTDLTREYFPGAKVLVFYNPDDISQNIALCCTTWRPRDRSGILVQP